MRIGFVIPLILSALAAEAEPLTAERFDSYTQGKTVYYDSNGVPYGAETYLRNRRVRWSFLDGACQEGSWYPEGEQICFLYDGSDLAQCWDFELSENGISAVLESEFGRTELQEVPPNDRQLICPGPEVGV
ncbi:hypothetical protein KMP13_13030 [Epibacterium ulvae]|uniref:hypothetical protein n=1 Tax=Epibacterium ulvae TaxID=1156985 RepID=UPI001BFC4893|nr:hypothetical protein [Epibacterium ulvae]MBT8154792.1 hypothetical protein [Epibacterium ulvae]